MKTLKFYLAAILLCSTVVVVQAATRQMEKLDRGFVVLHKGGTDAFLSWRLLADDPIDLKFNIYRLRSGKETLLTKNGAITLTNYLDPLSGSNDKYILKAVVNGVENPEPLATTGPRESPVREVLLDRPATVNGIYKSNGVFYPDVVYSYSPGDASVGDVDGDGQYEIILKWDPSNAKDNSQGGYTGNVYIDCYKLDGTKLWRIDLGRNIRAGAHYTQFMVYDLDGDGKAEIVMKTADGTVDGVGKVIGAPLADYRTTASSGDWEGFISSGPEYLTFFNGETGAAMKTVDYTPNRTPANEWGKNETNNRVDRFLACIAYLDGVRPSVVMCRGYYGRATLAAYNWRNGELTRVWYSDTRTMPGAIKLPSSVEGQGNHSLAVGDVDNDGFDEIVYGAACIDHNGYMKYTTGWHHGDAHHMSQMFPDKKDLYVWQCHENSNRATLRHAGTGVAVIHQKAIDGDNGRAIAADIDPRFPGFEMWSVGWSQILNVYGDTVSTSRPGNYNFRVYWDGDLQDELLDGNRISKWTYKSATPAKDGTLSWLHNLTGSSVNGSKSNPVLSVDLYGDWREEVILSGGDRLYINSTTISTNYRMYTLMHDPVYRTSITWQNVAYNQPPHLGIYIGNGMPTEMPDVYMAQPASSTGKEEVSATNPLKCKISRTVDQVTIQSPVQIISVKAYSLNGSLLNQMENIRNNNVSLPMNVKGVIILRIETEQGNIVEKVM